MTTPNGVIEPIEAGWQELTALVESLGPAGLTLSGADGVPATTYGAKRLYRKARRWPGACSSGWFSSAPKGA